MNILRRLFESRVEKAHRQSASILDIFTKTTEELSKLNNFIEQETALKIEAQRKLAEDIQKLGTLKENHDKVITKIAKIFE